MKKLFLLSVILFAIISSCKKEPGSGGAASIKGNIHEMDCGATFQSNACQGIVGADLDVYIIYGDEISYGDRVRTDYEGDFEFKYLRKGKYKVYVYSYDSTYLDNLAYTPQIAITKEVEISEKKQVVDIGQITVYTKGK